MSVSTLAPAGELRARLGRMRVLNWISGMILVGLVLIAVAAPMVAPVDPEAIDFSASLTGPSPDHLLGADQSGRDILSRLVHGARTSLLGPVVVLTIASVLGIVVGLLAAWCGGWVDAVVSRATDVMFAFPGLLFAVFTVAVLGKGLQAAVVALGVAYFPTIAKLTRSVAMAELGRPYVEAYRLQGMSATALCLTRLLPNISPVILGYVVVLFGDVLLGLAGLSFLGFGSQPPTSDWGLMVSEGQLALIQGHPLPSLAPAAAIVLTAVVVNIIGVRIADSLTSRTAA
ncbi:MAG: ABC transporter permease [Haloechinothrix sp.]